MVADGSDFPSRVEFRHRVVRDWSAMRCLPDRRFRLSSRGAAAILLALGVASAVAAPAGATSRSAVRLNGNGLGVVTFGSSVRAVTKAVSAKLGPPTGHPDAGCVGGYSEVAWHDLIAQFKHGRFTGYRYGVVTGVAPPAKKIEPTLETAKGISLGSTFAQARRAYPLTQTGTFFWRAPNGVVFALESSTYPAPPSSPIYEIKVNACPAAL